MDPAPKIAVAFNAYEPRPVAGSERRSEESVAEMAEQVAAAVRELGWPVTLIPLQRSIPNFLNRIKEVEPDVLVNLCEGFFGRPQWEANVAGLFELLGLPFTGSALRTLALCQDKFKAKAILRAAGLPTAPAQLVLSAAEEPAVPFPAIVKPDLEDASLGIYPESVVRDAAAFRAQVERVLEVYRQPAIAEKFIDGREFNVAVMENSEVEALPVSEIDFSQLPADMPRICGYEAKWFEDHPLYQKTPPVCPAPIADDLRLRLQDAAVAAFRALGCRDYARVDFRMDKKGEIFILEVNPNPDISLNAGYARALKAAGREYSAFWGILLENARQRKSCYDPVAAAVR